jgi:hypothetical protein
MSEEAKPIRPVLPVADFSEKATPIQVGMFGQGVAGWLVGARLESLALALVARDGRQSVILTFEIADKKQLRLIVKDQPTPGLGVRITAATPRYLTDAEIDALVMRHQSPTSDGLAGAVAAPRTGSPIPVPPPPAGSAESPSSDTPEAERPVPVSGRPPVPVGPLPVRRNAPVALDGALAEVEGFAERFWSRVRKTGGDGCWIWSGARTKRSGYGIVEVGGRRRRAHRVAYALARGGLEAGPYVLHSCDTPPCVRPSHLVAADQLWNMVDASKKGRLRAKLTAEQALQVKVRRAAGETLDSIAADLHVDRAHVSLVGRGRKRPHVEMPTPQAFAEQVAQYRVEAARRGIRLLHPRELVSQLQVLILMATGHSYSKAARALRVSKGRVWNALHPGMKRLSRRAVIDPAAPAATTITPPPTSIAPPVRPIELTEAQLLALLARLARERGWFRAA